MYAYQKVKKRWRQYKCVLNAVYVVHTHARAHTRTYKFDNLLLRSPKKERRPRKA